MSNYNKCTSKGIGRQGVVLKHRISLQKEPMPCRHMPLLSKAPKDNGIGARGSKNWVWF